jgi:hypothetical protein
MIKKVLPAIECDGARHAPEDDYIASNNTLTSRRFASSAQADPDAVQDA